MRPDTCHRYEVLGDCVFDSIEQVREVAETSLHEYNEERPHDSLGRVPPLTVLPRPITSRGVYLSLRLSA